MGICIVMSNMNFPRLAKYRETNYCIPCIPNDTIQIAFRSIFTNLTETSDDEAPLGTTNIYWKAQTTIDIVLQTCKAL